MGNRVIKEDRATNQEIINRELGGKWLSEKNMLLKKGKQKRGKQKKEYKHGGRGRRFKKEKEMDGTKKGQNREH